MKGKPYSYTQDFLYRFFGLFDVFDMLDTELAWVQREAPRKEYWTNSLNRPYTYGRGAGQRTYESQIAHPMIDAVADILEERLGFRYEGCFLNRYQDEHDSLGWHSDDDLGINHDRPIAVVTVGAARDIMIRPIAYKDTIGVATDGKESYVVDLTPATMIERVTLESGSLLLMKSGMQQTHQHRIPKGSAKCGPRISLTFRSLK